MIGRLDYWIKYEGLFNDIQSGLWLTKIDIKFNSLLFETQIEKSNSFGFLRAMRDSFKYKGMRRQLVRELKKKGIQDQRVLDAFEAIPRHFFLDNAFAEQAYSNMASELFFSGIIAVQVLV